ncbi:hypothetical protein DA01_08790 [Dehalococcoides mccartyi]|uniref:Uncharacterized protein n=1 Tax=Dehalococcoides mccartyi TaxID=61435 RepID=A0A0V8LXD5_9CHLR|nr:hypothetical protein [Dehalococcoides mccartyi]KSV16174.1 hypothetical protein DA01_08790 [Dehalococcoides mccartyi]
MAYEPTLETIGQMIEELQKSRGIHSECGEVVPGDTSFKDVKEMLHLPIINQALKLYENQPKWQDKPDKEGWWWVFSLYVRGDPLIFPLYPIHILFCDGELHADTSYPEEFPSISNYIKTLSNPKWLYIPEPHITNPTPDGGNL